MLIWVIGALIPVGLLSSVVFCYKKARPNGVGSQYCLLPPPSQKVYNCGDAITAPDVLGQPHWLGAVLQTLVATSQCLR